MLNNMHPAMFEKEPITFTPQRDQYGEPVRVRYISHFIVSFKRNAKEPIWLSPKGGLDVMQRWNNEEPRIMIKYGMHSATGIDDVVPVFNGAVAAKVKQLVASGEALLLEDFDKALQQVGLPDGQPVPSLEGGDLL